MEDYTMQEEPIADDGLQPDEDGDAMQNALAPVERSLGFILDEQDEKKVAEHVIELREDDAPARSRRRAVWTRNRWWREGRRWVRLQKAENQSLWQASIPDGMASAPPVPNKTDRLCRRLVSTLLVDKPFPECEPGDDSNEARDAAEFATRYLTVKGARGELNMNRELRAAAAKAQSYASCFGWVTMDPTKGGHRPRTVLAHPQAEHADDALVDPASGLQASEETLVERYQRPDGFLTDDPQDADLQWMPAPRIRRLTGLKLTFIPATAQGIDDAVGVVIADVTTLGDLKALFPDAIEKLTKDQLQELCTYRPDHIEDLLPLYTKSPADQKFKDGPREGEYKDAQVVVTHTVYYESCSEYPYGCYAVIGGNCLVLHRQKWTAMMEGAEGQPVEECLLIPVGQCICLDDDTNDDGYGIGIVEHFGPADEIRATALGFEIEHMFRSANPIPFLPIGSIVQPKQFIKRDGSPVFTNPQGKPEWENVPGLSSTVPELRDEMGAEMDSESGLEQAAQGVEDSSVNSGIHAQTIVQEALKAVVGMKDNIGDYYVQLNTIILQLSRAYCTVPDLLAYTGKDGQYKQQEFSRTDFRTTRIVSIAKGSFTMHTLLAKQEMANNALDRKTIDADDYNEMIAGGISPVLGYQENPFLMRIRRQLEAWKEGPPEGWLEQAAAIEAQNQQAAVLAQQAAAMAPQTAAAGLAVAPPPPPAPPAPPPPHPFSTRLKVDLEPMAAKIRHRQLSRVMASTSYENMPPQWQQVLDAEYDEMKNAAGVMTVPDVQRAQASQPPALPKGVSIALKADAGSVGEAERAAIDGMQGGAGQPTAHAAPQLAEV